MASAPPNSRASLLAGLRTGGVRSVSANVPHTAAPGVSFNIPRFSSHHQSNTFPEEEEEDQLMEMPQNVAASRAMPMTAAVDGPNNRFVQQQRTQRGMNPNSTPFSPSFSSNMMHHSHPVQEQALQMQMLQLEMIRLQAMQTQQFQAEILAQAQLHQQQQSQAQNLNRRANYGFDPPATAGPMTNSFDLRNATLSAQMRRTNQSEHLKSQLGLGSGLGDQPPMTAALGGRFGSRSTSLNIPNNIYPRFVVEDHDDVPPPTPSSTTVISGGTSLGSLASNNVNAAPPSKSDTAASWRRGGNNNSVLSGNNRVTSPSVKVTPPPSDNERVSPPPAISTAGPKYRPQPLRFNPVVSQPLPAVTIDTAEDDTDADTLSSASSTKSAASNSSPTTPHSSASSNSGLPLSPREEASKKLYEGLGIGRPTSATSTEQLVQPQNHVSSVVNHRLVSQPTRQPRGPPSGADELGPKNFATRIRRKAIGGLGVLMGARERRECIEAY